MPIIVPIQEFGREHHRTLASLPQEPNVRSASKKRLLVSWWDREVRIWTISKCSKKQTDERSSPDVRGPQGRRLVAKIALQVRFPTQPSSGVNINIQRRAMSRLHQQIYHQMGRFLQSRPWQNLESSICVSDLVCSKSRSLSKLRPSRT